MSANQSRSSAEIIIAKYPKVFYQDSPDSTGAAIEIEDAISAVTEAMQPNDNLEEVLLTTINKLIIAGREALDYSDGSGRPILEEAICDAKEILLCLPDREQASDKKKENAELYEKLLRTAYEWWEYGLSHSANNRLIKKYYPNENTGYPRYFMDTDKLRIYCLEHGINVPVAATSNDGSLFIWDVIDGSIEEMENLEDCEKYVKENYADGNVHPDIDNIILLKQVGGVSVTETGGTTEVDGKQVPNVKVDVYLA